MMPVDRNGLYPQATCGQINIYEPNILRNPAEAPA